MVKLYRIIKYINYLKCTGSAFMPILSLVSIYITMRNCPQTFSSFPWTYQSSFANNKRCDQKNKFRFKMLTIKEMSNDLKYCRKKNFIVLIKKNVKSKRNIWENYMNK
ncbi:hypothetical protein ACH3XW_15480 [Acanthocheilonema viteae]